jgi:hypothetical protein
MWPQVARIAPGVRRKWQPVARMWAGVDVIVHGVARKWPQILSTRRARVGKWQPVDRM